LTPPRTKVRTRLSAPFITISAIGRRILTGARRWGKRLHSPGHYGKAETNGVEQMRKLG
jgi:hypothetical protein